MRKNIGLIGITPSLAGWLRDKLLAAPEGLGGAAELAEGLADLADGESASLMLSLEEEESRAPAEGPAITIGDLTVAPRGRSVTMAGRAVMLTPKEFDILYFLAKNRGEVFTKEQIYRAVWDEEYLMDDSNIMAFIRKLRKKIEPNPDAPEYILTIWGVGYKMSEMVAGDGAGKIP